MQHSQRLRTRQQRRDARLCRFAHRQRRQDRRDGKPVAAATTSAACSITCMLCVVTRLVNNHRAVRSRGSASPTRCAPEARPISADRTAPWRSIARSYRCARSSRRSARIARQVDGASGCRAQPRALCRVHRIYQRHRRRARARHRLLSATGAQRGSIAQPTWHCGHCARSAAIAGIACSTSPMAPSRTTSRRSGDLFECVLRIIADFLNSDSLPRCAAADAPPVQPARPGLQTTASQPRDQQRRRLFQLRALRPRQPHHPSPSSQSTRSMLLASVTQHGHRPVRKPMMIAPRMRCCNRHALRAHPVDKLLRMRNRAEHHRRSRQRGHFQLAAHRPDLRASARIHRCARSASSASSSRSTTKSARSSAASGSRRRPAGSSVVSKIRAMQQHDLRIAREPTMLHPVIQQMDVAASRSRLQALLRQPACSGAIAPNKHRHRRSLRNQPWLISIARCRVIHAMPRSTRSTARDVVRTRAIAHRLAHPRSVNARASAITNGVFPAPPTDRLPTLTTGHASRSTRRQPRVYAMLSSACAAPYIGTSGSSGHTARFTRCPPSSSCTTASTARCGSARLLLEHLLASRSHGGRRTRILQQRTIASPTLARSTHAQRIRAAQQLHRIAKVFIVRPHHHRHCQPRRFQRIVPSRRHQAATHKRHRRQPIHAAQLANRVQQKHAARSHRSAVP